MTTVWFHPFHASLSCCKCVEQHCCEARCVILLLVEMFPVFLACLVLPSSAIVLCHRQLLTLLVAVILNLKTE